MGSNKKPPGNIHNIREFELEKIHLADEFDILQIVGEGWFGKILLVEHRATDTEMVLKALPKPYVSLRDFYREFHYGLHLGVHKNIVTTYDVAFETAGFYVFTQEYAPLGDLTSNVSDTGIGELHSKRVAKQIASALDYMHSKEIVHRDVKLDNVLIYRSDFSRVKLCDFGESHKFWTLVERRNEWLPYSPPEVLKVEAEGTYQANPVHDVWQFAIVIFVCLTGCLPWQRASQDDPRYFRYLTYHNSNMMIPLRRTPKLFKLLSSKGARMFRKFLEPRAERRPKNLADLSKFMDDRWLAKGAEKEMAEQEPDELCPSMYSFHSSPEEKNRLLSKLVEHGIEVTVDRAAKKNRIRDWIESSVITEEDEEEDSGTATPSSTMSREPIAGHISSVKAEAKEKIINTTLKDASNKHFDPRTGMLQDGPSEMGAIFRNQSLPNIYLSKNMNLNNGNIKRPSRNDVILSEGQFFQSEYNLHEDDRALTPLVNPGLDIQINNNNSNKLSNLNYNESASLNFPESMTMTNNTIKNSEQYNLKLSKSAQAVNNGPNSSSTHKGLVTALQSAASVTVPEITKQFSSSQTRISNASGSTSRVSSPLARTKDIQRNDSLASSLTSSGQLSSFTKDSSPANMEGYRDLNQYSMKDTAYDRYQRRKK